MTRVGWAPSQIWPAEMEEMLDQARLPGADIDMPLAEYAKLVCSILDIPVHSNGLMEPLHLLFTLFSDFKVSLATEWGPGLWWS